MLILNNFDLYQSDKNNNTSKEGILDEINISSNLNLSDTITGSGVDQEVRINVNNVTQNLNDNQDYFEIPSDASEEMFLTYGNFSFSFQNNYTTDYVIEDDDALYADNFISFDFNTSNSDITIHNGSWIPEGLGDLTDDDLVNYIDLNATDGVLNFTISANFTNTEFEIQNKGFVQFNRTKILALISPMLFTIEKNANLTLKIKNYTNSKWKEVISSLPINNRSETSQEVRKHIINENLNFINLSNVFDIQFIFERWDQDYFYVHLHEYDLQSTYAFDLPITNESYVALEFDLKGLESAVHGLNVWIRTLNLIEAADTHFNITLYRANTTIVRTELNLRVNNLEPDDNDLIDKIEVDSYTGDNYTYFKFDIINTGDLNLSNYFIVIKSNSSKHVYSLVTLPWFDYPDDNTEHQLKTTVDDGQNWSNAKKVIETDGDTYTSGQLDASLFTLNVTRGYMPSDFNVSGTYNLTIQDLPIEDLEINSYPYNGSSYLTWGVGRWIHNFTTPINDGGENNFTINLLWDKTNIKGFEFNVSYSVNAYWVENVSATYSVTYNSDPEWVLEYNLNKSDQEFINWSLLEFWFVYDNYFNADNLTNPNSEEILNQTGGQTVLIDDPSKFRVAVLNSTDNPSGLYTLHFTSYNFIHKMQSYINYNGTLWETNGFMYGDNISISAEIQDHQFKAPISGDINATLFYPNGTRFLEAQLNSSDGIIDDSTLLYEFGNQTILNLTNSLNVFGEYHLGFFWCNGSAIGCKEIILYIDTYEAELYDLEYYSNLNKNIVDGKVEKVYQNYTYLIASVNETTGISRPNFYPINDYDINTQLIYEIGDQQLPILIDSFKQSQNIINPSEIVNVKVTIKNLYEILPVNAKINVKLVSLANEEWIITENTTNNVSLKVSGHPDDTYEFDMNLKIPDLNVTTNVWAGKNNPIRLAGVKTLITVFIDDNDIGAYETGHFSLLSSETSNNYEGHILGLKINEEMINENLFNIFNRDECLYFPYNTSVLVNVFDRNYVSSYKQCTKEFSLNLNSKFTNISINPENPIKGQSFNINSILVTEFGEQLVNKNVIYQYYDSNSWVNLGSDFTDSNGFTTFMINTQQIDIEGNLLIRLSWNGDNINGVSKNVSINVIPQSNNISISINKNSDLVYRNRRATMTITLRNIGESNLRILRNISIEFNYNLSYSIITIDFLKLEQFSPEESTNFIVEIDIGNINNLEILISITAQNTMTNESKTITAEASFPLNDPPIFDYFINYFVLIVGAIFAVIWIAAVMYAWKTKKRIETPIEEPTKKKPRRERYVSVSELKKPTPPKKTLKKKEEPKEDKEKKPTDLDSLLEERGLADKKKKT